MENVGFLACVASATLTLAALCSCAASAQTLDAAAGAQAVAIVGGGGGSSRQTLRTNPDAIAAPVMTAHGSCYVGDGSIALGSYLFGGVSGSRTKLDEGCEARADAGAHVAIAYARMEMFGDEPGAWRNLDLAERRMTATRAEYLAARFDQPWPDLWKP